MARIWKELVTVYTLEAAQFNMLASETKKMIRPMHWDSIISIIQVLLLRWVTLFFHVDEFAIWDF